MKYKENVLCYEDYCNLRKSPSYQKKGIGTNITKMLIDYVDSKTQIGGRSSIQLIAEKGKEPFYEKVYLSENKKAD